MVPSARDAPSPYAALVRRCETWLSGPRWALRALLFLLATSLFLSTPAWERLPLVVRTTPWRVFQEKARAPLSQPRASEASHSGKTTFRLVVPLVARVLGLGPYGVLVLQAAVGVLLLALSLQLGSRETQDRTTAFLLAAGLAFSYVGKAAFVDLFCWFDGWAFLFLLAALASRGPLLPFVFATLAAWTDERAVIALGLVVAFHLAPVTTGLSGSRRRPSPSWLPPSATRSCAQASPARSLSTPPPRMPDSASCSASFRSWRSRRGRHSRASGSWCSRRCGPGATRGRACVSWPRPSWSASCSSFPTASST